LYGSKTEGHADQELPYGRHCEIRKNVNDDGIKLEELVNPADPSVVYPSGTS
jgi:hypothetical protein